MCDHDGCETVAKARGMCRKHYNAWYRKHRLTAAARRDYNRHWRDKVDYNGQRRQDVLPRRCPVCGESFMPTTANQVYCPPTRRDGKSQARSRCARRGKNANYRGVDLKAPIVKAYDCAWCEKPCVPGENVVAHASKFCGRQCKMFWHHRHGKPGKRGPSRAKAKAPLCRLTQKPDAHRWMAGPCVECGAATVVRAGWSAVGYCSRRCQNRVANRRRRARLRQGYVRDERLGLRQLIADADGRCRLCGGPVDTTAMVPSPHAPTVDHIIPLAAGGTHTRDNVQLAHFLCNSLKGDGRNKAMGAQMALV